MLYHNMASRYNIPQQMLTAAIQLFLSFCLSFFLGGGEGWEGLFFFHFLTWFFISLKAILPWLTDWKSPCHILFPATKINNASKQLFFSEIKVVTLKLGFSSCFIIILSVCRCTNGGDVIQMNMEGGFPCSYLGCSMVPSPTIHITLPQKKLISSN